MTFLKNFFSVCCILFIVIRFTEGQKVLTGKTYIERQLLCALEKAPCDVLGRQVKDALPEIIGRNCQSCDQKQLANAKRIARFVQVNYPEVWNELVRKYSPQPSKK